MSYVFDPARLHTIVREVISTPDPNSVQEPAAASDGPLTTNTNALFDRLVGELDFAYPGKIALGNRKWIFNNAGGAMGQMTFLHVSLDEYLILFGTPIGTEGHSGRYAADVYDILIAGEMWGYVEGDTERSVIRPGEMHHLEGRAAKGYRIPDHAWMLEYARGSIASMIPFGIADTVFSTLDLSVLARTLSGVGSLMLRNALSPGHAPERLAVPGARRGGVLTPTLVA